MNVPRYMWQGNQRYYLYESYPTWREAYNVARYQKKKNRSKYYILQVEEGTIFPTMRYYLYLNRVFRIW